MHNEYINLTILKPLKTKNKNKIKQDNNLKKKNIPNKLK